MGYKTYDGSFIDYEDEPDLPEPEIRAEPEIKCANCDTISKVAPMEGLGTEHHASHKCPECGMNYSVRVEVEWMN